MFRLDRRDPLPRRAKNYTLNVEIPTASRQPITAKAPAEFTAVSPERAKVLNYSDSTFDSTVKTEKDCGPPEQKAAGSSLVQSRHGPIWAKEPWQGWNAPREEVSLGRSIRSTFEANRDSYVTLIDVETSGRVSVVWPNAWQRDC